MKYVVRIIFVVSFLICASTVEAQILTGRILGVVRDESGAVPAGITVTLESPALPGGPLAVLTNDQGEFRFTELPPGVYQLSIALSGFRSYVEPDLRVSAPGAGTRVEAVAPILSVL